MRGLLIVLVLLMAGPAEARLWEDIAIERGKPRLPIGPLGEGQQRVIGALERRVWPTGRHCLAVKPLKWVQGADGRYGTRVEVVQIWVQPRMEVIEGDLVAVDVGMWTRDLERSGAEEGTGWIHTAHTEQRLVVDGLLPRRAKTLLVLWLDFGPDRTVRPATVLRGPSSALVHGPDAFVFEDGKEVPEIFEFEHGLKMPIDGGVHATTWGRALKAAGRLADLPSDQLAEVEAAVLTAEDRRDGSLADPSLRRVLQQVAADPQTPAALLGWLYGKLRDHANAAELLSRATREEPGDRDVALAAAQELYLAARREDAWQTLAPWMSEPDPIAVSLCRSLAEGQPARAAVCEAAANVEATPKSATAQRADPSGDEFEVLAEADDIPEWLPIGAWSQRGSESPLQAVEVFRLSNSFAKPSLLRVEVKVGEPSRGTLRVRYNPPEASWLTQRVEVDGPGVYRVDLEVPRTGHTALVVRFKSTEGKVSSFGTLEDPLEVLDD